MTFENQIRFLLYRYYKNERLVEEFFDKKLAAFDYRTPRKLIEEGKGLDLLDFVKDMTT